MKQPPYSLAEAEELCKKYQSLRGQRFRSGADAIIDCIAVTPFDQVSKNRFIIYYLLFDDAKTALGQDYQGLLYDVLIIAGAKEKQELMHEDMFTWLKKNKPPCYSIKITRLVPTSVLVDSY